MKGYEPMIVWVPKGTLVSAIGHCLEHGWKVSDYDPPKKTPAKPKINAGNGTVVHHATPFTVTRDSVALTLQNTKQREAAELLLAEFKASGKKSVRYGVVLAHLKHHFKGDSDSTLSGLRRQLYDKGVLVPLSHTP